MIEMVRSCHFFVYFFDLYFIRLPMERKIFLFINTTCTREFNVDTDLQWKKHWRIVQLTNLIFLRKSWTYNSEWYVTLHITFRSNQIFKNGCFPQKIWIKSVQDFAEKHSFKIFGPSACLWSVGNRHDP